MVIKLPHIKENTRVVMQRLGYNEHRDRHAVESSFTMRLSGAWYPRFHGYIEERPDAWLLKLHLDMQESKAYGSRHGGVYEGEIIAQEAARIQQMVGLIAHEDSVRRADAPMEKKRGFWGRLFG